jgi:hypothetical protein
MKSLAVSVVLFFAIVPALAQKNILSKVPPGECPALTHAHRYSDVRIAGVEVNKVEPCGFSFVNLEDNSLGVDNFLQFSSEFCVTRAEGNKQEASEYRMVRLPKKDLKKGRAGPPSTARIARPSSPCGSKTWAKAT